MFKTFNRRIAAGLLSLALIAGIAPFADAAVNYATNVITGRLLVTQALIQGQTLGAATGTATAGQLVIGTSSLSGATGVLATINLPATCCSVSGNTLTLAGVPLSANPTASGTAALAEFRNNSGTTVISGLTVGTTGTDIVANTATVATGVPFQVTSGTIVGH